MSLPLVLVAVGLLVFVAAGIRGVGVGKSPTGITVGSKDIHYAWVIVAVASVMWTMSSAIRFATSLLVSDFENDFGWDYGLIALAFTFQWVLSGSLGPLIGWFGDRHGVRKVMFVGAILFIVGMLLVGTVNTLWQFWLYFGVILAAAMAIFQITLISGVTVWFRTNLGVAMGTLQGVQGIGTAIMIAIVAVLFSQFGLKWTFWGPGLVGGLVLLMGVKFFLDEPAQMGARPYGAPKDEPIQFLQGNESARVRSSVFLKQAQRTTSFWNLIGIHFWGCAGHNIILVFLVAITEDESVGLSRGMAVAIYIILTIVSTLTRFGVPIAADRAGSKGVMGVSFAMQTFPLLLLLLAVATGSLPLFFLFAILFGIGMGGEMSAFPIINRQYYGNAPTGTTYGYQMMGAGIGMAVGPLAAGFLWDVTGVIWPMIILSFALSLIGVVSIVKLPGTHQHVLPDWEEMLPAEARSGAAIDEAPQVPGTVTGTLGAETAGSD
ncbi:MAG: hypothetical protein BZY81_05640 [SAR202 cluster bacterium Io17-Chloro-G4]|nr:MAG: hypothetical protein BZY81_05640 [SAR202 cluster bacterium Io17-Chloro-G4]